MPPPPPPPHNNLPERWHYHHEQTERSSRSRGARTLQTVESIGRKHRADSNASRSGTHRKGEKSENRRPHLNRCYSPSIGGKTRDQPRRNSSPRRKSPPHMYGMPASSLAASMAASRMYQAYGGNAAYPPPTMTSLQQQQQRQYEAAYGLPSEMDYRNEQMATAGYAAKVQASPEGLVT
eukprot:scaffold21710_cov26-Attheya_sp.AAC.1